MKIRIRWADVIALGIVSLMIIGGMLWIFIAASDAVMDRLPPCAAEDSDNCHWDASSSGNGTGESFYVIDGDIHYLP